jgi:hypothetical protein
VTQPEHPSAERISDLLAGVLPASEAMEVNAHLASCAACRDARDALLDLTALLADEGATPVEMPPDVTASLDAAISRASNERPAIDPRRPSRQPWRWLTGAAAAVVVVGIGFAGLRALPHQGSSSNAGLAPQGTSAERDDAHGGVRKSAAGAGPSRPPGASPLPSGAEFSADGINLTPSQVQVQARRLALGSVATVPPKVGGCARPITGDVSTLVKFDGGKAVLTITRDLRLATIYDCATATNVRFTTGY